MKYVLILLAFTVFSVSCFSVVSNDNQEQGSHIRMKRATCDIGSFTSKWFTPHHAFCAAHCVALGHKGGYCKGTICHCRN